MQSAAAGMAIIDLQGRWVDVNPALARLLGHDDVQTLHGQPVSDSFHPDDAERAQCYLAALAEGARVKAPRAKAAPGQASDGQALPRRYRNLQGAVFQARAEVSIMHDDQGAPCYLVMHLYDPSLHDIGQDDVGQEGHGRHDAGAEASKQELADAELALQALTRQQEVLAHGISHDLRAPLRAIASFSALLQSRSGEALDDTGRDHLQRIRAAAARMGGLLDALLDLSRVERTTLAPEAVDISLLADWVAADLQDAHPDRDAKITVTPGLQAYGNEYLLRMLLQQLLDNAWRFSGDRDSVRINVDGQVIDDKLRVTVRDHGSGFDMRYADKIMEPFQRLHTPEQGGSHGIGLAIAKRIVERHGGWLRGQSQDDTGSVFTFELPAVDADPTRHDPTRHDPFKQEQAA